MPQPDLLFPLEGKIYDEASITTPYGGKQFVPKGWEGKLPAIHSGIDIAAPKGSTVVSPATGQVVLAGDTKGPYGKAVYVRDQAGGIHLLAHLSEIYVREGMTVQAGDRVGAVGNSGAASGSHLHYELRQGGQTVDPAPRIGRQGVNPVAGETSTTGAAPEAFDLRVFLESSLRKGAEELARLEKEREKTETQLRANEQELAGLRGKQDASGRERAAALTTLIGADRTRLEQINAVYRQTQSAHATALQSYRSYAQADTKQQTEEETDLLRARAGQARAEAEAPRKTAEQIAAESAAEVGLRQAQAGSLGVGQKLQEAELEIQNRRAAAADAIQRMSQEGASADDIARVATQFATSMTEYVSLLNSQISQAQLEETQRHQQELERLRGEELSSTRESQRAQVRLREEEERRQRAALAIETGSNVLGTSIFLTGGPVRPGQTKVELPFVPGDQNEPVGMRVLRQLGLASTTEQAPAPPITPIPLPTFASALRPTAGTPI